MLVIHQCTKLETHTDTSNLLLRAGPDLSSSPLRFSSQVSLLFPQTLRLLGSTLLVHLLLRDPDCARELGLRD